jgi:hypothetical protein
MVWSCPMSMGQPDGAIFPKPDNDIAGMPTSSPTARLHQAGNPNSAARRRLGPHPSGVLVHIVHEMLGFGRGEVDVVSGAVPAGDADREPASAGAEGGLAFCKCA